MSIDWDRIMGREIRGAPKFSQDQIDAAVAAVNAMPGGNKIPTFWPKPKNMPDISDVDFGDVQTTTVPLKGLMASNNNLKRDRLLWHVKNPGKALHNNPFTAMPLVCTTDEGTTIIDGHHRIAALQLLGATKSQVYNLPMN